MRKLVNLLMLVGVLASGFTVMGGARAQSGHVLSVADVSVDEGNGNIPGLAVVTVQVSPAPEVGEQVKVDFGTSAQAAQGATAKSTAAGDPTPEFPEDFAQTDGTVTFAATQTSQTVSIPVLRDNANEANETFYVKLFNARGECVVPGTCETGASIGDDRATVTLNNDDAVPTLAVDNVTHDEGNGEEPTAYDFTVTKTGGSGSAITVSYQTVDGSASAGSDYTTKSGTLTFVASSPTVAETQTVSVAVSPDSTFEPSENFKLKLSNAVNATLSNDEGLGTIANDDVAPPPSMSVSDASGNEGDAANFVVTLSSPPGPGQTAVVDWALEAAEGEGVATEGTDYQDLSGSAVFTAGEDEQTISVPTTEDLVDELDETFTLKLTKPSPAGSGGYTYSIAQDFAVGTITDDDAAPSLSVGDVRVEAEGAGGETAVATFTVTKNGLTDRAVTVHYATADDAAVAGADYVESAGELSFAPEETEKQVSVNVSGDGLDEIDETFVVQLSEASGATIGDDAGVGTIVDDDEAAASFAIGDVTVSEGSGAASVTVTRTGETGRTTTVKWATADATARKVADYTESSGSLSFASDETSKSVSVPVRGDAMDESNEWFLVNLSEATDAAITDAQAVAVITDDDAAPAISIGDGTVLERSDNSCNLTVKLTGRSSREITVQYATASGTAGTADYAAKSGSLRFAPGAGSAVIKIYAKHDTRDEPTERFSVKLSGIAPAGSATFADSTGTCSITDND